MKNNTHGGARPNSGRKRNDKGVKVTKHLRLYPPDIALIVARYGTLQKWADSCIPTVENSGATVENIRPTM